MNRLGIRIAASLFLASLGSASLAFAQSSGVAPRAPGELGPTSTNPTDSGFGTTQGVNPF